MSMSMTSLGSILLIGRCTGVPDALENEESIMGSVQHGGHMHWGSMRFGRTAKVLAKRKLEYYRISVCGVPRTDLL